MISTWIEVIHVQEHFLCLLHFSEVVYSLLIANIQPYKKNSMSILNSLILANMALLAITALDRNLYTSQFLQIVME